MILEFYDSIVNYTIFISILNEHKFLFFMETLLLKSQHFSYTYVRIFPRSLAYSK
jgi:hypothetical protein